MVIFNEMKYATMVTQSVVMVATVHVPPKNRDLAVLENQQYVVISMNVTFPDSTIVTSMLPVQTQLEIITVHVMDDIQEMELSARTSMNVLSE